MLGSFNQMPYLLETKTRAINAENPTGEKGKGCLAVEGTGARAARRLGKGWKVSPSRIVKAGETFVMADVEAEGVIQSMWIGGDITRNFILRMYWDGDPVPAVECPLPDFFGNGWLNNLKSPFKGPFQPLNSLPVCINPNNSLNCYWPMPFRKSFKITLENRAERDLCTFYQINFAEEKVDPKAGYFHTQFRRTNPVPFKQNFIVLDKVEGEGKYMGTALSVGLNGGGNWWGEGEIKFYMDGDTDAPTLCSTGTEDYFGGSYDWEVDGKYVTYSTPFSGMYYFKDSNGLYDHQQRFAMYRWHIPDPIKFEQEIRIELQDLGWYELGQYYMPRQDDFSATSYFYLNKTSTALPELLDDEFLDIV